MNLSDRLQPSKDVVARKVGGEIVLLDLESGQYFGLDSVGARIWELIECDQYSLSDIRDQIIAEYDATADVIEKDLLALVGDLRDRKLVTSVIAA